MCTSSSCVLPVTSFRFRCDPRFCQFLAGYENKSFFTPSLSFLMVCAFHQNSPFFSSCFLISWWWCKVKYYINLQKLNSLSKGFFVWKYSIFHLLYCRKSRGWCIKNCGFFWSEKLTVFLFGRKKKLRSSENCKQKSFVLKLRNDVKKQLKLRKVIGTLDYPISQKNAYIYCVVHTSQNNTKQLFQIFWYHPFLCNTEESSTAAVFFIWNTKTEESWRLLSWWKIALFILHYRQKCVEKM